jgi:hypothetical protein
MPAAPAYSDVAAALISYRKRSNDVWLTLIDLTCDLAHLARYMHSDIDRCLSGDTGARLDERVLSAMPRLAPSVRPVANTDDTKSADHAFDVYVHASDAAEAVRVHTAQDTHLTFSAALTALLADLRTYAESIGFDFNEITRAARSADRVERRKAE